jgi:hypothetical protein
MLATNAWDGRVLISILTQVASYKSRSFLAPLIKGGWGDQNLVITAFRSPLTPLRDPPSAPLSKGGTSGSFAINIMGELRKN